MYKITFVLIFMILFGITSAYSQEKKDTIVKKRLNYYSLTIGTGWSHYINSMELGKENAKEDFIDLSLRFLWEPEHRLSLGLETGYYRIFSVKSDSTNEMAGEAKLYALPLLLVVRMRIVDHFYLSVAPGMALLFSKVDAAGNKSSSMILSAANFEATASYIYPLGKRFSVGGELRFFSIGKTNDFLYSVNAVCAVKL